MVIGKELSKEYDEDRAQDRPKYRTDAPDNDRVRRREGPHEVEDRVRFYATHLSRMYAAHNTGNERADKKDGELRPERIDAHVLRGPFVISDRPQTHAQFGAKNEDNQ